jgi:FixJ family two-component response regulator
MRPAGQLSMWPQSAPIVYVVDNDVSVREALECLIRCAGWHPETFASAQAFLCQPPVLGPHCLVLDVTLPGIDGLELQRRLAANRADLPIIFLSAYVDVPTTVRAMKGGAVEFLTKPFHDQDLLTAIRHAIELSRAQLDYAAAMQALRERYARLSRREREVLALVVAGRLNRQVASELCISEITVKAHRGNMMQKMAADTLADLVVMASRLGVGAVG